MFSAEPSQRQVIGGWRGTCTQQGNHHALPWPGDAHSAPQALGPQDESPAHEGGQARLQGAGGARPLNPGDRTPLSPCGGPVCSGAA